MFKLSDTQKLSSLVTNDDLAWSLNGDDHAITIETDKIDVLDDTENFNSENHQIITIETDELEDSASLTEEECINSIANVEFLDDVQDDLILDEISHSITTEADEQDHLLHNTQDSKSETITLKQTQKKVSWMIHKMNL